MPPLLVRLNLPGFSSPEPFRLASAPPSMTGLACAVLEEIGGFSKEELEGVRSNLDRVPLTLLGEICANQLVELASDEALGVFLATAHSPRGPAIIEVRPREAGSPSYDEGRPPELTSTSPGSTAATTAPSFSPTNGPIKETFTQPGPGSDSSLQAHALNGQFTQPLHASTAYSDPPAHASAYRMNSEPSKLHSQPNSEPHRPPYGSEVREEMTAQWPEAVPDVRGGNSRGSSARAGIASGSGRGQHGLPSSDPKMLPNDSVEHQANGSLDMPQRSPPWGAPSRQERSKVPVQDVHSRKAKAQSRGGSRASTPTYERRAPNEDGNRYRGRDGTVQGQPPAVPSQTQANERQPSREAPVYVRLYHEKDERRRRLEEARLRDIQQKDEEIRNAARRALGRAPSPGRAMSPSGRAMSPSGRAMSPSAGSRGSGARTPPRTRPPLPERPSSASSFGRRQPPGSADESQRAAHTNDHAMDRRNHEADTSAAGFHGQLPSPTRSPGMSGAPDASSIASDGAHGLQSVPSMGTLHGEESLCGDMIGDAAVGRDLPGSQRADDMQSLQEIVRAQQHRIEFLETRHQQALRELRKSREELATSQQQRLKEANKNLELEQLITEMQAMPFDSVAHDHARWQDWLRRSRCILESEA